MNTRQDKIPFQPAQPNRATLRCLSGPMKEQVFFIPDGTVCEIGRAESADININDKSVSRRHCRVFPTGDGGFEITDLNSSNGTRVNDKKVDNIRLNDGDLIHFGSVLFVFNKKPVTATIFSEDTTIDLENAIRRRFQPGAAQSLSEGGGETTAQKGLNAVCALSETFRGRVSQVEIAAATIKKALEVTGMERAAVVLKKNAAGEMEVVHSESTIDESAGGFQVSGSIAGEAIAKNESLLVFDAMTDDRFNAGHSIISGGIRSVYCVPIGDEASVFGVLYVDTISGVRRDGPEWLSILSTLGHQAGVAFERAWLVDDLQALFTGAMRSMIRSLEARDEYTSGHAKRVTLLALQLADSLSVSRDERDALELGGLMHDIGKIGIRDVVLSKPGKLTEEEFEFIKEHPVIGTEILGRMPNLSRLVPLKDVVSVVRSHHERPDGKGYPDGLSGSNISRAAKILSIADVWDALTTDRPYRPGMSRDKAWTIMDDGSGNQFDADFLACFRELVYSGAVERLETVETRFGLTGLV